MMFGNMPTQYSKSVFFFSSLMAILKYSSSSIFFKYMLCSSLFFVVFALFVTESYASGESHKFHTVQISSLLPASDCSTSTITTKGSSNTQSTMKVFHRHSPCRDKSTTIPSLSEVLSNDQSRVKSIQNRLNPNPSTNKINEKKTTLPAQSGRSLGSGNYLVKVGLGTPPNYVSLIFDTGSDLTWTQCQPCARSCYKQQDPIFNPSTSTSYSNISCTSNTCSQLTSATGNNPGCSASTCVYGIQYGDQSFSVGFFVKDKLTISNTDVFPSFLFGCGQNNQGLFGTTAGLIGLGRDDISIVSQTSQKYGKYFSYCLPSTSSSTGYLALGKSGTSRNAKFTPLANSQGTSFYFIDIVAITIGGKQVSIDQSIFKTAGTIIDSGTVITRLPSTAYSAVSSEFAKQMTKYKSAPAYSILDTCYDFGNATSVTIPTISIIFSGNAKVDLHASGILVVVDSSRACLAFVGNSDDSNVGIFGNTQQKTLQVVYDVAGGQIGFGAGGCK